MLHQFDCKYSLKFVTLLLFASLSFDFSKSFDLKGLNAFRNVKFVLNTTIFANKHSVLGFWF
jgi:hypothetical protein